MLRAQNFKMSSFSLFTLIGKTPKFTFNCEACNTENSGRIYLDDIEMGKNYFECKHCNQKNLLPIRKSYYENF